MTRLTTTDICDISSGLVRYNERLLTATGKGLLGIASHAYGIKEETVAAALNQLTFHVIPVTAGLGIITDFSVTVSAILSFLGCRAKVAEKSDASGLAQAYEQGADAVMLADDFRFVAIDLHNRKVADNTPATGRVFATALDLMAGGLNGEKVLILGCGPVGEAGVKALLKTGAHPLLFDTNPDAAHALKEKIMTSHGALNIKVLDHLPENLTDLNYIFEATPVENSIPQDLTHDKLMVAAPGVPLGVSQKTADRLGTNLIHDKLELGVAAMAAELVQGRIRNPSQD
ncbi:MAG: 3-methylornithyl-N6-L-lysine dehydrogenase PylD [Desulfobacterales bacterium]|nr:3-methylornithyl-N6-L-lysine dehydrogenase PylD [Desulfobacterales bacterium]